MNNNIVFKYLVIAGAVATRRKDSRAFFLGAVAIRSDGAIVKSANIPTKGPTKQAHAEFRLSKKINIGSIVFVARLRRDGSFSLAKPCKNCLNALKRKKVKNIYYSISNHKYGMIAL